MVKRSIDWYISVVHSSGVGRGKFGGGAEVESLGEGLKCFNTVNQ